MAIKTHKGNITRQFSQLEDLRKNIETKKMVPSVVGVNKKLEDMTTKTTLHTGKIIDVYDTYLLSKSESMEERDLDKLNEAVEARKDDAMARENHFCQVVSEFATFVMAAEAVHHQEILIGSREKVDMETEKRPKNWRPNTS